MGGGLRRQLCVATRGEVIEAVAARYRAGGREEKNEVLDEFVKVTGFHRKHATRVLKKSPRLETREPRQRRRIYGEAVREALTIVWEATGRICGKRLHEAIAGLVDAMERHGHLRLDGEVRKRLLSKSAATMDRLLQTVRETGKQGRRKPGISTPLRKSIAVRTFGDWNDPPPGYFETDMVAHCGKSMAGSHVHSLVLTDIASGWTEAVAAIVRERTLVIESAGDVRTKLPFGMRGLDVSRSGVCLLIGTQNGNLGGNNRPIQEGVSVMTMIPGLLLQSEVGNAGGAFAGGTMLIVALAIAALSSPPASQSTLTLLQFWAGRSVRLIPPLSSDWAFRGR
jgi:hypothetical protein